MQRTQRTRRGKNLRDLYMGRPGKFGNPFRVVKYSDGKWGIKITPSYGQEWLQVKILLGQKPAYVTKGEAVAVAVHCFREWIQANPDIIEAAKRAASGHNCLSCWCKLNEPCHVDVWLDVLRQS